MHETQACNARRVARLCGGACSAGSAKRDNQCQRDNMGGDCCASNVQVTPPGNAVQAEQRVGSSHVKSSEPGAFQEDFSPKEFQEYCKKRVDLFLEYKQRQDEKVSG